MFYIWFSLSCLMQQRKCFIFVTSLKVNAKMKNPILSMLFLCMWEWKHIYLGTNIGDWGIPYVWNIISNGSMCHCRMLRRSRPYCIFIQRSLGMNLSFKLCLFSKLKKGEASSFIGGIYHSCHNRSPRIVHTFSIQKTIYSWGLWHLKLAFSLIL